MDRQVEAIVRSRSELNLEYVKTVNPDPEKEIEFLVMATTVNDSAEDAWDGLTQSIKKDIRKSRDQMGKDLMRINKEMMDIRKEMREG